MKDDELFTEEVTEELPETPEQEVPEEEILAEPEAPEQIEEPVEPEIPREPSRRESLRIQQLVSKLKAQEPASAPFSPEGLNYEETLNADPEVLKQLETDRRAATTAAYQEGLKQAQSIQFHTRLEIDSPRIEAKYPQMDKNAPEFNPAVADALNTMYLSTAGYDPATNTVQNANIRYADYIESMMELVEAAAGAKVAQTQRNIARQVASTAIRPGGTTTKRLNLNQHPTDMSDEELAAAALAELSNLRR